MTRRIVLIGSAAVAALWAPYIYAELARKPVAPASEADRADLSEPSQPDVRPTPALFAAPVEEVHAAEEAAEEPSPSQPPAAADEPSRADPADEVEHPPSAVGAANPVVAAAHELPPPTAAEAPEEGEAKPAAAAEPGEATGPKEPAAEGTSAAQEPAEGTAAPVPENETRAAAVARGSSFREVFERESRDPAWAVTEEPRVSELLRAAGAPAQEVRCQRTVCRIALSAATELAEDSDAYRRLRSEFGAGVAIARGSAEADPLAVFILRPGFQLE